jgi:tetratricopeptide (TPR) repeat protein
VRIAGIRLAQGKNNEAEAAVREAIRLDSEDVLGYIGLARLGVIERQEKLVNEGRKLLESESLEDAERLYDFGNALGDEYRLAGEDEKAEQAYRECIRRNPERAEAFIGLGQIRLSQDRPQGAEEWLPQALRIDRTNVEAYLAIGAMYEKLDKPGEAEQMFQKAIKISPWRPEAYIHLCSLLHRRGESEEAQKAYQRAKDAAGVGFLLDLGSYYELQRKMDDALEVYQIGLEYEPTEHKPDFLIALASLHARLNNLEQAEVEYRQAIELEPGRAEAYVWLAQMLADKGQLDEAIEVCNQMARQPELAYEAQISIGNLQAARQQYAEAEAAYRQAIDISPKRIDAYLQLASLCQQQDKLDEAEQLLRQAVQNDSTNAEAYYNLGMIYEHQEVFDRALESYKKATELAPKYGDAYRARGRIYANLKDTKGLDQMARDILEVGRDDIEKYDVYLLVAETYYTAGLYEQAIDYLNNAVTVDPERIDAHDALGLTYEAQQRWAEARNEYEKIGQLSPESQTDVHIKLARLFLAEDKPGEALGEFRKVALPAPDVSDPRLLLLTSGYLDVASGYRKLGKTEAMMGVCGEIVSLVQESQTADPDLLRHEGLAYLMRGEYKEASRVFRGVLKSNPADIKARLYLALSLAAQGEPDEAQSQLMQAIEQTRERADFDYAIIEAEVLAARAPEIVGAKSILQALREASEKAAT